MNRLRRYLRDIRPTTLRRLQNESRDLFFSNRQMQEALQVIVLNYECNTPGCDLHRLKPDSTETEFLCPGCAASLALNNGLTFLRIPTAPEIRAEFNQDAIVEDPPFGSVTVLKRAVPL